MRQKLVTEELIRDLNNKMGFTTSPMVDRLTFMSPVYTEASASLKIVTKTICDAYNPISSILPDDYSVDIAPELLDVVKRAYTEIVDAIADGVTEARIMDGLQAYKYSSSFERYLSMRFRYYNHEEVWCQFWADHLHELWMITTKYTNDWFKPEDYHLLRRLNGV